MRTAYVNSSWGQHKNNSDDHKRHHARQPPDSLEYTHAYSGHTVALAAAARDLLRRLQELVWAQLGGQRRVRGRRPRKRAYYFSRFSISHNYRQYSIQHRWLPLWPRLHRLRPAGILAPNSAVATTFATTTTINTTLVPSELLSGRARIRR